MKTASEKVDFSKTKAETPASEESDLKSEIFDQAPDGMSKEEFENWLDIDNNAEVIVAPPTNAQMREALQILRRGVQHTATNFQRHYE